MVVTGDDLRGQRVMDETEVLADVLLDERVDAGIGAHGTGDGAKGDVLAGVDETVEVALELPGPGAELHTEGHGFGVNAVGAAGAEGVALLEGTALADLAKLADVLDDEVAGLGELVAEGGVAKVRAGHAIVDPTAGLGSVSRDVGVDVLLHVGEEGDDIVAGDRPGPRRRGPRSPARWRTCSQARRCGPSQDGYNGRSCGSSKGLACVATRDESAQLLDSTARRAHAANCAKESRLEHPSTPACDLVLVRRQGIEPWTLGLKVPCSTN